MRSFLLRLLSALCFLSASPIPAAPVRQPKLIIAISVDQFAASVYGRYKADYAAGLKTLSSGVAFPVAYQSHAATETCPGHSTLLTGDHPSHTGIVANIWVDRANGSGFYCINVPGVTDPTARGPQTLRATTLGDWLKQAHPRSRVVSISGKDRGAIMMAGHHPDLVSWWVDGTGFQTSAYAGPADTPIQEILKREDDKIASAWRSKRPLLWPAEVPATCSPLEKPHRFGDAEVSGVVPPAAAQAAAKPNFAKDIDFQNALHSSPLYDKLVLDFAADMAQRWKLGTRSAPDLLAISLSATDYVGHRYGNGGAEMCAQVHALDRSLGVFLERIRQLHVPYMVVLTADHGSVDAPERLIEQGIPAQRVDAAKFLAGLNGDLKQKLNLASDPIAAVDVQELYIKSSAGPEVLPRVRDEAVSWVRQQPSVEAVFTRDQVAAAVPPPGKSAADLTIPERLNESYEAERAADIFVVFKKYATLGMPTPPYLYVAGHGSPWDYDRQVPLLFWWPGVRGATSPAAAETVDIAPTLASIIGIAPPPVDGRCLTQVAACIAPRGGEPGR